jgi:hypothetical protein
MCGERVSRTSPLRLQVIERSRPFHAERGKPTHFSAAF